MAMAWFLAVADAVQAQTRAPPLLTFGVTGSVSSEGLENPTNLLTRRQVQALVLSAAPDGIAEEPAPFAWEDALRLN